MAKQQKEIAEVKEPARNKVKEESAEDQQKKKEILQIAYSKIGGVPKNLSKTSVTKVGDRSYRVNIWTSTEGGIMLNHHIEHSFFLTI
jgi:hypothetical protein